MEDCESRKGNCRASEQRNLKVNVDADVLAEESENAMENGAAVTKGGK